jgi:hypothetical protein
MIKKQTLIVLIFLCINFSGFGQVIFSNLITGNNPNNFDPYINGQIIDPNITVSGIGRGTGINGFNGNDRYNARDWNLSALDIDDYFYFTITPNTGYEIDFISFEYTGQSSQQGPVNIAVRSSLDGYTNNIGTGIIAGAVIDLSAPAFQNINSTITFRVYAWGGMNNNGTFSINDFAFNGRLNTFCSSTSTWDGASWSLPPSLSTHVIINGDYNTTTNGSFSSCSLIVNSGSTLIVDDGSYVLVENDVTIYGDIIVRTSGSLVQVNDSGTFTLDPSGNATVEKETAEMKQWYEYTYWSSPTETETVGAGLSDAQSNRRFGFNGANYLDSQKEIGNSNSYTPGQDDIDDNNNDWFILSDSDPMVPGMGYASTHNQVIFNSSPCYTDNNPTTPCQFTYTFEGAFNTGIISVPVYRNDSELNDNNWNFIGNPYPSAIDANLFLAANSVIDTVDQGGIDGVIYFWSQTTPPSRSNNGNQVENFSQADYAIINASGENPGGDNVTPDRFIPSGQGFFVAYSNSGAVDSTNGSIKQGTVTFNNAMRVNGNNTQFFRNSNSKENSEPNKLSIKLTSDNGVFNQILVAYVNGASDDFDGLTYDAPRNLSTGAYSILYSIIENNDKKFAIQGKDPNSLDLDETIAIGFDTSIDVATLYTLSIAQIEGNFFNNNAVYLKDYDMNTIHNLSDSDYTFTSEVGEFKDRFEIVFNDASLGINQNDIEANTVTIIELDADHVKFKASNNLNILNVQLFDVLGRQLYNFKGNNNVEIYNLSSLSQATYIAKIELSNGAIITKKAIKK